MINSKKMILEQAFKYIDQFSATERQEQIDSEGIPDLEIIAGDAEKNNVDNVEIEDLEIRVKGIEIVRTSDYKRLVCTTLKEIVSDMGNAKLLVESLISSTLISVASPGGLVSIFGVMCPPAILGSVLGYVAILTTKVAVGEFCRDYKD